MTEDPRALLTVDDVAKRLNKTPTAIRNMRARGHLPAAVKIRKSVRWKPADIEAWLAAQPLD